MKKKQAGILSIRALNQYRTRDVLTYLGLRYYLENLAAQTDAWARKVSTDLVLTRSSAAYFQTHHFKEYTNSGQISHRKMFLPGANEALAEAALIDECSKFSIFSNPDWVYSYRLTTGKNLSGIFVPYMAGFRDRHNDIARACERYSSGVVQYTDIKQFYSSIKIDLAYQTWRRKAGSAGLSEEYRDLGEKLIENHSQAFNQNDNSILTGPAFSHLLGNLVLRELDEKSFSELPAKYFRYVDDIVLVGNESEVAQSVDILRERLSDLGLNLHDNSSQKSFKVPTNEWLRGRKDFHESFPPNSWANFIWNLKKFLLLNHGLFEKLQDDFRNEGFRIPLQDYREKIQELNFLERCKTLTHYSWFRFQAKAISIQSLLSQARDLRGRYEKEFYDFMEDTERASSKFEYKRCIPKLRYRAGRLIYLATDEQLRHLYSVSDRLSDLQFHSQVMKAVANKNIDDLLLMGSNAAQAAAQPIRALGSRVSCSLQDFDEITGQGLAVFYLNGVTVDLPNGESTRNSELIRFAKDGSDISLMKSTNPFIQEISCLHGLAEKPRHPDILSSVFDMNEELVWDAIDQFQRYESL